MAGPVNNGFRAYALNLASNALDSTQAAIASVVHRVETVALPIFAHLSGISIGLTEVVINELNLFTYNTGIDQVLRTPDYVIIPPESSPTTPLIEAIKRRNIDEVLSLLDRGATPDFRGELRMAPALHVAVALGELSMVELLLERGASINLLDAHVSTALCHAAQATDIEMAALLLENGALPNEGNIQPLAHAALNNSVDMINLLLDHGAAVNALATNLVDLPLEFGSASLSTASPLLLAVKEGNRASVELLIRRGANPNTPTQEGIPLMHAIIRSNDLDMIRLLVTRRDNRAFDEEALQAAIIYKSDPEVIALLLSAGANPNQIQDGRHPLISVLMQSNPNPEVIRLLLAAGANANAVLNDRVPLIFAVGTPNPNPAVIRLLLLAGANINRMTDEASPLLSAIAHANQETVQLLVDEGADVNAHPVGVSPPILASIRDRSDTRVFELLRANGADLSTTFEGADILAQAITSGSNSHLAIILALPGFLERFLSPGTATWDHLVSLAPPSMPAYVHNPLDLYFFGIGLYFRTEGLPREPLIKLTTHLERVIAHLPDEVKDSIEYYNAHIRPSFAGFIPEDRPITNLISLVEYLQEIVHLLPEEGS